MPTLILAPQVAVMLLGVLAIGCTKGLHRRIAAWTATTAGGAVFVMLMLAPPDVWVR